jgi:lipopolysaccharide export system protein LptA
VTTPRIQTGFHPASQLRSGLLRAGRTQLAATLSGLSSVVAFGLILCGWISSASAIDFRVPFIEPHFPISITADRASTREQGTYIVYELRGKCTLVQGDLSTKSDEAVLWVDKTSGQSEDSPIKTIVYLDQDVEVRWSQTERLVDQHWTGRLFSKTPLDIHADQWVKDFDSQPSKSIHSRSPALSLLSTGSPQSVGRGGEMVNGPDGNATQTGDARSPTNSSIAVQPAIATQPNLPNASGQDVRLAQATLPRPTNPLQAPPNSAELIQPMGEPLPGFNQPRGDLPLNLPFNGNGQIGSVQDGNSLPLGGIEITPDGQFVQPQINLSPVDSRSTGSAPQTVTSNQFGGQVGGQFNNAGAQPVIQSGISARTFRISGRTSQDAEINFQSGGPNAESIATVTRGLRVEIGGVTAVASNGTVTELGKVFIEADRAVLWTRSFSALVNGNLDTEPLELYLEGNIYFKQGQREIYADRMYYNASSEYGTILDAEVLTSVPQYEGLLRLKADVVQQRSRQNVVAYNAALTSSRLGVPRYWLQSGTLELSDNRTEAIDPITGLAVPVASGAGTGMEASARSNFVYAGGIPVFYWPTFKTNANRPSFFVTGATFKTDGIFGTQAFVDFDLFQILGIDAPDGTDWTISPGYLSERGPALGTNFNYNVDRFIFDGPTAGLLDAWGVNDSGLDTLGSDRVQMQPEETLRGRVLFRHRQILSEQLEFFAEGGYISDRNFLEQYFEQEWDQEKDYATGLRLRRYNGNRMLDLSANARVNSFFTETERLPQIDYYWLGQNAFFDRLTYYGRSTVGYVHQRTASAPTAPQDAAKFALQPYEVDAEGLKAVTRQEIDAPFNLGVAKVVPYLNGEAAFWGEDINGDSLSRFTGQAGIRSSVPLWTIYPDVESRLFNVNGLAHKITLETESFYADSSRNIDELPLYDPLDDNAQEHFRRRLVFNTFGGVLPDQFDPRGVALRSGMQRYVTAASDEIVDDQLQSRIGINNRWQTKRGRRGNERVTDLVEFDLDFVYFHKADRDNFGEDVGGINYDFRYHLGDRVTLLSDGYFDVFSQGLKAITVGGIISRPGKGEWYFGATSLEGPISSFILASTINYRLNEKFILTGGTAVDLGDAGNIGQNISLTRIGESFLVRAGVNIDSGRDNVAFVFGIEPRFFQTGRLGAVGGQLIPPAGLYGLE